MAAVRSDRCWALRALLAVVRRAVFVALSLSGLEAKCAAAAVVPLPGLVALCFFPFLLACCDGAAEAISRTSSAAVTTNSDRSSEAKRSDDPVIAQWQRVATAVADIGG